MSSPPLIEDKHRLAGVIGGLGVGRISRRCDVFVELPDSLNARVGRLSSPDLPESRERYAGRFGEGLDLGMRHQG